MNPLTVPLRFHHPPGGCVSLPPPRPADPPPRAAHPTPERRTQPAGPRPAGPPNGPTHPDARACRRASAPAAHHPPPAEAPHASTPAPLPRAVRHRYEPAHHRDLVRLELLCPV